MKQVLHLLLAGFLVATVTGAVTGQQTVKVFDFEDASLLLDTVYTANANNIERTFDYDELTIKSFYETQFGGFWSGGWAVSTSRNDSLGTFRNLGGSAPGGGADGSRVYLVGQPGATLNFPQGALFGRLDYTNTTYTADVAEIGSAFSRPFGVDTTGQTGVEDSLILVIGLVDIDFLYAEIRVPLADYRGDAASDFIVREWTSTDDRVADSISYRRVTNLTFRMESSDFNEEFMSNNTPNFFAIDNVEAKVDVVSTRELAAASPLAAFPNPAQNQVTVGERKQGEIADLFILDLTGRIVSIQPGFQLGNQLDIRSLQAGVYYISVASLNYRAATKLVVK